MKCNKCGTEFTSNFCPNCGNSINILQRKPKNPKKVGIILICIAAFLVLYIMLFSLSSLMNEDAENGEGIYLNSEVISSESSEPTYIEISAQELWDAFEDNEIAAEEKYEGKLIKITGIVSDINSEDLLTSNNILLSVEGTYFGCVQCNFNSGNAKALVNIQKGQNVTIIGTCGDLATFNVMVNACELQ